MVFENINKCLVFWVFLGLKNIYIIIITIPEKETVYFRKIQLEIFPKKNTNNFTKVTNKILGGAI